MNLQCEKAVEKIWWFGYNKEKSDKKGDIFYEME